MGTTAWAVLCELALDAQADAHGNLVAATNVRRIAANLGISKDTAARALARLVDAGLVVRHCRRGAGGHFVRSRYELRLDPGDGITAVVTAPGRTSPCPVVGDTVTGPAPSAASGVKQCARPDGTGPGPPCPRPGQEALFELGTEAVEPQ